MGKGKRKSRRPGPKGRTNRQGGRPADAGGLPPRWVIAALAAAAAGFGAWALWSPSRHATSDRAEPVEAQPAIARSEPSGQTGSVTQASARAAEAALATRRMVERQRAMDASFDPRHDGWETEAFASAVSKQLKGLAKLLAHPEQLVPAKLAPYAAPDFEGEPLRPASLATAFRSGAIEVRRTATPIAPESAAAYRGVEGLGAALRDLLAPLRADRPTSAHVKVYRVRLDEATIQTTVDFELDGTAQDGSLQHNATWRCVWARPTGKEPPRLKRLYVVSVEEALGRLPRDRWFVDCTESVLSGNRSFRDQIVYGLNHWIRHIERLQGMQIYARTGLAVGDVNGDGRDDVYLCQPGGLPNRLYVQNEDGTATDRSAAAGVDWLEHTSSALFVDLDNDGDQDLSIATTVGVFVMENDGTGTFAIRGRLRAGQSVESLSAADYDADGDLDLYLCVYRGNQGGTHFLYHDANDGGPNHLFRNEIGAGGTRQWRFRDVTEETGLNEDNTRWSLASAWEDVDNDGDQDLYVADDYGQNCLYRNDDGHFTNVAAEAGVVDFGNGMSASWGDFDRDGWMDLYVGNMFSSAGNRIANQQRFQQDRDEATRRLYRRFAKGNSLYRNAGGTKFEEVGRAAGVEMARWAWSSLFMDVDNDGWEDLLVVNGFITAEDSRDL